MYKEVWGHLPESLRQEMNAYSREQFMAKYEDLIKQYYARSPKSAARKTAAREGRLSRCGRPAANSCYSRCTASPAPVGLDEASMFAVGPVPRAGHCRRHRIAPDDAATIVPDGSASSGMITPDAQRAIESGLAFLERSQHADGSFGTGIYRPATSPSPASPAWP